MIAATAAVWATRAPIIQLTSRTSRADSAASSSGRVTLAREPAWQPGLPTIRTPQVIANNAFGCHVPVCAPLTLPPAAKWKETDRTALPWTGSRLHQGGGYRCVVDPLPAPQPPLCL